MSRFVLQQSEQQGWWVCTDTENGIVCRFQDRKFNDTQEFTFLDDVEEPNPLSIARMMREMGDWLSENHSEKLTVKDSAEFEQKIKEVLK